MAGKSWFWLLAAFAVLLTLQAASAATETSPFVITQNDGLYTAKTGHQILANINFTLDNITKVSGSTPTKAYILSLNNVTLSQTTFSGNTATFTENNTLTAGTYYYIVVDNSGGTYTVFRNVTGFIGYPQTGTAINWTKGVSQQTGVSKDTEIVAYHYTQFSYTPTGAPTPDPTTYFNITAKYANTGASINTFNATINGTVYGTTNGTIITNINGSLNQTHNITLFADGYYNHAYTNWPTNTSLSAHLANTVITATNSYTGASINTFNVTYAGYTASTTNGTIITTFNNANLSNTTVSIIASATNYFSNTTNIVLWANSSLSITAWPIIRAIINLAYDGKTEIGTYTLTYNGTFTGTANTTNRTLRAPLGIGNYTLSLTGLTNIGSKSIDVLSGGSILNITSSNPLSYQIKPHINVTLYNISVFAGDTSTTIKVISDDWNTLLGSASVSGGIAVFSTPINLTENTNYWVESSGGTTRYYLDGYDGENNDGAAWLDFGEARGTSNTTVSVYYSSQAYGLVGRSGVYSNLINKTTTYTTYARWINFTILTFNTFNISFYNESSNSLWLGNVDYMVVSADEAREGNTSSGSIEEALLTPSNYTISYWYNDAYRREYYITLVNGSYENIRLYLIESNISEFYIPVVTNADEQACGELEVSLMRYFIDVNGYRVVEMAKTDTNGQAVLRVVPNTINYKLFLNGDCGMFTTNPQKIITNTDRYTVTTAQGFFTSSEAISDALVTFTFTNATNTYVFSWLDTSNTVTQGCIYVYKTYKGVRSTNYSQCDNSSTGSLIYTLSGNLTDTVWSAQGVLHTNTDYSTYTFRAPDVSFLSSIQTWGVTGVFWGMIALLGLVMVSAYSSSTVVFSAIGGLVVLMSLGIIAGGGGVIGGLLIVGAIMLYKITR